jgi:glyoxylase-like metal-dependent hydrolase (beta-lactamase superfamily II)
VTGQVRREVVPSTFRLGDGNVNRWLVVDRGKAVVVDAGLPAQMDQLRTLLGELHLPSTAIEAVVVTHGHIDHLACIPAVQAESGAAVHIPRGDRALAATTPALDPKVLAHSWRPAALRTGLSYLRQGVRKAVPVVDALDLDDGDVLDAPGHLRFLSATGHTPGSGMFLADGGVLFTGDVLVTLDPFSGRRGPRTLPAFDNVDHEQALASLDVVGRSGATVLLPGHGEPWRGSAAEAAATARQVSR